MYVKLQHICIYKDAITSQKYYMLFIFPSKNEKKKKKKKKKIGNM